MFQYTIEQYVKKLIELLIIINSFLNLNMSMRPLIIIKLIAISLLRVLLFSVNLFLQIIHLGLQINLKNR